MKLILNIIFTYFFGKQYIEYAKRLEEAALQDLKLRKYLVSDAAIKDIAAAYAYIQLPSIIRDKESTSKAEAILKSAKNIITFRYSMEKITSY